MKWEGRRDGKVGGLVGRDKETPSPSTAPPPGLPEFFKNPTQLKEKVEVVLSKEEPREEVASHLSAPRQLSQHRRVEKKKNLSRHRQPPIIQVLAPPHLHLAPPSESLLVISISPFPPSFAYFYP